jgi:hypothetical protein
MQASKMSQLSLLVVCFMRAVVDQRCSGEDIVLMPKAQKTVNSGSIVVY